MKPEILALLGIFFLIPIVVAVMVIYLRRYTHTENMKALELGVKVSDLKPDAVPRRFPTLRFALLFIGIGLGILCGTVLHELTNIKGGEVYFSSLFVFGGLGLLASYLIESKREKDKNDLE